jgi:hypothetical protein
MLTMYLMPWTMPVSRIPDFVYCFRPMVFHLVFTHTRSVFSLIHYSLRE